MEMYVVASDSSAYEAAITRAKNGCVMIKSLAQRPICPDVLSIFRKRGGLFIEMERKDFNPYKVTFFTLHQSQ